MYKMDNIADLFIFFGGPAVKEDPEKLRQFLPNLFPETAVQRDHQPNPEPDWE